MTNEEALNEVKAMWMNFETQELAIEALEKQIQKKHILVNIFGKNEWCCPRCKEILHSGVQLYCADCGQALDFDWSAKDV